MTTVFLNKYVIRQMEQFFPDGANFDKPLMTKLVSNAHERMHNCFSHIKAKYYNTEDGEPQFNYLNGDQYASFLYFLSNEAYKYEYQVVYEKTSLLNKYLHGIDLFGHIEMPDIFLLVHPMGTIIGRAKLRNYLVIYQNVTIGGTRTANGLMYPDIGEGTVLYSNCSVIGECKMDNNVVVGANTRLINTIVDKDTLVVGSYPDLSQKKINYSAVRDFFYQ